MAAPSRRWTPPRWVARCGRIGFAFVVLGVLYTVVTFVQVWLASGQDTRHRSHAIVVLGAAQYNGEPSGALQGRLDHAYELWSEGVAPLIVVTGGNQPGDRTTEGLTGFRYLRERGIPESALLVEIDSTNTYEALSASALILSDRGLTSAVLVSDPYHNLRLRSIADEVGIDAVTSAAPSSRDTRALARETVAVGLGRFIGFRRLARL